MEQWSARGLPEKKEQVKGLNCAQSIFGLSSYVVLFFELQVRKAGGEWAGRWVLTRTYISWFAGKSNSRQGDYGGLPLQGWGQSGKKEQRFQLGFYSRGVMKKWEAGMCIWMRKLGSPAQYWNRKTEQCPHSTWVQGRKRNEKLLNTHKLKLMFLQATWIRNSKYSCAITIMFTKLFTVKWL